VKTLLKCANPLRLLLCCCLLIGDLCDHNINDCLPQPCQNGARCIDGISDYICECSEGYTGQHCDVHVSYCHPDPCYHGVCTNVMRGYYCTCHEGWEGARLVNFVYLLNVFVQ
jgi:Notch-like protein